MGKSLMLTPTASSTALTMAGATVLMGCSPMDLPPCGCPCYPFPHVLADVTLILVRVARRGLGFSDLAAWCLFERSTPSTRLRVGFEGRQGNSH